MVYITLKQWDWLNKYLYLFLVKENYTVGYVSLLAQEGINNKLSAQ